MANPHDLRHEALFFEKGVRQERRLAAKEGNILALSGEERGIS
jgi:hypothetical protein